MANVLRKKIGLSDYDALLFDPAYGSFWYSRPSALTEEAIVWPTLEEVLTGNLALDASYGSPWVSDSSLDNGTPWIVVWMNDSGYMENYDGLLGAVTTFWYSDLDTKDESA